MIFVNLLLIVIIVILLWMVFNNCKLVDCLILWLLVVDCYCQYDWLVIYGFIYVDWLYLIFNMIILFFFGGFIESVMVQLIGSYLIYLVFYIGVLLVLILFSYLKNQKNLNYFSFGVFGVVLVVLFVFILIKLWLIILVFFILVLVIIYVVFYVGYSIWMDKCGGDCINYSVYLVGVVFGVIFMLVMQLSIFNYFLCEFFNLIFCLGGG